MVKITYLHHSGFAVELDRVVLLFDVISEVPEEVLGTGKPMIFVVTHGHHDHYDSSIFRLRELGVPIRYIISDDIELPRADDITMIKPDERLVVRLSSKNELIFRTFGSTDRGISLMVNAEDSVFFYSGDLNWWAWDTEKRPHIDPHAEERDYKHEISKLKRSLREPIDFAFVPVDPRLDAGELKAALWFIRELHPQYLIAMHFWDDFDIINRLNEAAKGSGTKIPVFTHRDEVVLDLPDAPKS